MEPIFLFIENLRLTKFKMIQNVKNLWKKLDISGLSMRNQCNRMIYRSSTNGGTHLRYFQIAPPPLKLMMKPMKCENTPLLSVGKNNRGIK